MFEHNFLLKDLVSRLKTFNLLRINLPDDDLIINLIIKLLHDKQIIIKNKEIFHYILKRIERSYEDTFLLIENIDTIIKASINSHIEMEITINNPSELLQNDDVQNFENDTLPISPLEHYNKILVANSKKKQSRKIS